MFNPMVGANRPHPYKKATKMNVQERKDRFTEIMTTVALMPDEVPEDDNHLVFPNLTKGLEDVPLINALMCQVQREDEEFTSKLCVAMTNSAMTEVKNALPDTDSLNESVYNAFGLVMNILWSKGQGEAFYGAASMLYATCRVTEHDFPALAFLPLQNPEGFEVFGKINPLDILEGTLNPTNFSDTLEELKGDE